MNPDKSSDNYLWIPSSLNDGWIYTEIIRDYHKPKDLLGFLTSNYRHSSKSKWLGRIRKGEVKVNNVKISNNVKVINGDLIAWCRPPWEEKGVPASWEVLFDNQDVLVINKPSGLQTTPGGGFLKHTLTELLKEEHKLSNNGLIPKPVHRLGRFTSGVLLCARKKETRAALSALFRNECSQEVPFRRIYLGLAKSNKNLQIGKSIQVHSAISRCLHPYLGEVWNTTKHNLKESDQSSQTVSELKAHTQITLIEKRNEADLLELTIFTGRPHQIRIHLASIGTPLIGDPFYKSGGEILKESTPGEGGYLLHAQKLLNVPIGEGMYSFEAPTPIKLKLKS